MNRLAFCLLALTGCIHDPAGPHRETTRRIERIAPDSVDGWFAGLAVDSLPSELGAPWRYGAFQANLGDGALLTFLPLDAEDEHRYLVRMSRNDQHGPILAVGFMEPTWFSPGRAETLATYEGWVFLYDLTMGLRRISVLFEGGTLLERDVDFPYHARPPDALADGSHFACLAQELLRRPDIPARIHWQPHETEIQVRLAQYVRTLFRCTQTRPAPS